MKHDEFKVETNLKLSVPIGSQTCIEQYKIYAF